jgi:uncharacterized protein (DUF1684 family)
MDYLELADWRRVVSDLYAELRLLSQRDPRVAHARWCDRRESLYRHHPQSPVPFEQRRDFQARYFDYDPALRFDIIVQPNVAVNGEEASGSPKGTVPESNRPSRTATIPTSTGEDTSMQRLGMVEVPFPQGARRLTVYWMSGYAGGLYLPFRDATNGVETYIAGRYLLDAAKSADLGGDLETRTLILDFNFAYHPSCAFDPRWACPLTPPENRLDIAIHAGERLA